MVPNFFLCFVSLFLWGSFGFYFSFASLQPVELLLRVAATENFRGKPTLKYEYDKSSNEICRLLSSY